MFTELTRRLRTALVCWLAAKKVAWKAAWQAYLEADRQWLLEIYGFDPFDKGEES